MFDPHFVTGLTSGIPRHPRSDGHPSQRVGQLLGKKQPLLIVVTTIRYYSNEVVTKFLDQQANNYTRTLVEVTSTYRMISNILDF